MTLTERFWSKADRSGGPGACWPWLGGVDRDGYGYFHISRQKQRANRVAFSLSGKDAGAAPLLRHTCGDAACVNPGHLVPGTDLENAQDREAMGRTARGERNARAKITEAQAVDILRRYTSGQNRRTIAAAIGLDYRTVSDICGRRRWRHLPCAARVLGGRQ